MSIIRKETGTRMSKIVIHNDTVYLSGQVPDDLNKNIKEQTTNVLEKVDTLLQKAGSNKQNLLSATVYVSDMRYFQQMNEVWDSWQVEGHTPVRACVAAKMSKPECLVEVCVIAALNKD